MMPWHPCSYGFGGFTSLLFLVLIGLVLWLVFGRHRYRLGWPPGASPHNEPPLEIAKRRYARGEITREEFEEIKKNLA